MKKSQITRKKFNFVFQKPRGKPGPKPKTPKVKNEPKPPPAESTDENDFVIGDLDDPFAMFFDNIVLLTDNDSDPICGPFLSLPSKKLYPDYYEDIEHPIALEQIRQKVIKRKYRTMAQVEEDVVLMCNNAREYNVEGSQIFRDATTIMRFARQKSHDFNFERNAHFYIVFCDEMGKFSDHGFIEAFFPS